MNSKYSVFVTVKHQKFVHLCPRGEVFEVEAKSMESACSQARRKLAKQLRISKGLTQWSIRRRLAASRRHPIRYGEINTDFGSREEINVTN